MIRRLLMLVTLCGMLAFMTAFASGQTYEYSGGENSLPPTQMMQEFDEFQIADPVRESCESACQCGQPVGAKRCGCRVVGGMGAMPRIRENAIRSTVKTLVTREVPSGTQGLNMPYHTPHLYHYKRPYNTSHVRAENQRLESHLDGNFNNPNHLYSTEVFDQIHSQLAPLHHRSTDLGYLEYSDWKQYEAARQEWNLHRPVNSNASLAPRAPRVVLNSTSIKGSGQ